MRATPAGDQPENWRATNPRTGGRPTRDRRLLVRGPCYAVRTAVLYAMLGVCFSSLLFVSVDGIGCGIYKKHMVAGADDTCVECGSSSVAPLVLLVLFGIVILVGLC